jgi:hypothetical protein
LVVLLHSDAHNCDTRFGSHPSSSTHAFYDNMSKSSKSFGVNNSQLPTDITNVDDAWNFLNSHAAANIETSTIDIKKLRRKIDWHILPLMFLCYTMQFLDKVILNYAAVMGLQKELKLKGNEFSNIATFLFVGLLCFEIPNSTSTSLICEACYLTMP